MEKEHCEVAKVVAVKRTNWLMFGLFQETSAFVNDLCFILFFTVNHSWDRHNRLLLHEKEFAFNQRWKRSRIIFASWAQKINESWFNEVTGKNVFGFIFNSEMENNLDWFIVCRFLFELLYFAIREINGVDQQLKLRDTNWKLKSYKIDVTHFFLIHQSEVEIEISRQGINWWLSSFCHWNRHRIDHKRIT